MSHYGPHLVMTGAGCAPGCLAFFDKVAHFLRELPALIGMTIIDGPFVKKVDDGVSGLVLIAESHIAIHTWPAEGIFDMDVFSCKDFDAEEAVRFTAAFWAAGEWSWQIIKRGLDHGEKAVGGGRLSDP